MRCCALWARKLVMPNARSLARSCSSAVSCGLMCRISGAYRYSRPKVLSHVRAGQANHAVKTVVEHALGPVAQVVALAQVVHDHGLAAAHRLTGRPSAGGAVFVPAHAQLVQISCVVASVGRAGNRLVFVVVGKAHPAHAVAANVHRDLADGLQQGRFRRRAHQGFVAGTQRASGHAPCARSRVRPAGARSHPPPAPGGQLRR